MAKAFPTDNPFLHGYYGPVNTEADAGHLHITGEMPNELCGTLSRNGPNPQFAPRGPYHWFGGDGMIHAFHIENGNVAYKNRWVRTPKWELENKEGEGLSGTFNNPRYSDPRIFQMNSTIANTNIVWHGGKLLALEEAHAPFALDPATLMPMNGGYETWGDRLCGPFTTAIDSLIRACLQQAEQFQSWPFDDIVRIAAPDDRQRAALDQLRAAASAAAKKLAAECPKDVASPALARLDAVDQSLGTAGSAFAEVEPTLRTFYAALDDEQKARLLRDLIPPKAHGRPDVPTAEPRPLQHANEERAAINRWAGICERLTAALRDWPTSEIERSVRF